MLAQKSLDSTQSITTEEFEDAELISNEDALEELFNLEDILTRQESRIMILREAIAACKFKSGLPPLIPLRSVKDDIATSFMTMNELYALRERKNLDVETLYLTKDHEKIGDSFSTFPSFVSPPQESSPITGWGEPQHTPFDAQQAEAEEGAFVPQRDEGGENIEELEAFTDEEEDDEEDIEVIDETNENEEELFSTEYKPPDDDKIGEEAEGEGKDGPSYPLNIIPDDQMPQSAKTGGETEEEEGEGGSEEEMEYEQDPLPVAKPVTDEEEEDDEEPEV